MTSPNRNPIGLLAGTLALILLPLTANAADLPDARQLMDKHVKAIGGRKAIEGNSNGTVKATMEIVEAGMKSSMVIHSLDRKHATTIAFPNVGEFKSGVNGDVVWSHDPMNGPRLLEGKERAQQLELFDPKVAARDASLIKKATTTALADSEGRACYRVEIEWNTGRATVDCYGTDDGLLLSTEATVTSPMGEIKSVSHFSDYKAFGKTRVPTSTRAKANGMTQLVTIDSIDETKPAVETVALPPAIEALVKKAAEPKVAPAAK